MGKKINTQAVKDSMTDTVKEAKEVAELILDESNEAAKKVAKKTSKKVKKASEAAKGVAKETAKATTKKVKSVSETVKENKINKKMYIQYSGKEFCEDDIYEMFKKIWLEDHKLSDIKELKTYIKLEDDTAYCVVNGDITVPIKL